MKKTTKTKLIAAILASTTTVAFTGCGPDSSNTQEVYGPPVTSSIVDNSTLDSSKIDSSKIDNSKIDNSISDSNYDPSSDEPQCVYGPPNIIMEEE